MNDRMNKEELLDLINNLKLDKNDYYLLSSSALVIRDIYPDAGDLDIAVSDKGLNELKQNYNLILKENGWYTVDDKIECICKGDICRYNHDIVDGIKVQNINEYLDYLYSSTREKDKKRIPIVENYINSLVTEKCVLTIDSDKNEYK